MKKQYDIAAFIWPSYTGDEKRTRMFWKEGYGEWQTVQRGEELSRGKGIEGYVWNRKPLWGYVNEANPDVMEMEISCAAKYGVNVFIYDWYWYDNRPFLENCLNDGYLKAKNNNLVKFYLMWANHNVNHYWDVDMSDDYGDEYIWLGKINKEQFKQLIDRWINKYFLEPSYYKIDGCPVFMIYEPQNFFPMFDSLEDCKEGIEYFKAKVREAGFPDLHLQMCLRDSYFKVNDYFGETITEKEIFEYIGVNSISNYHWIHLLDCDRDYADILPDVQKLYDSLENNGQIDYFPHVSCGWDKNPRFKRPSGPIIKNPTPQKFEKALRMAKDYADTHNLPANLITINSWNEWTETSYLQPDNLFGYGYLEAVKKVFDDENK